MRIKLCAIVVSFLTSFIIFGQDLQNVFPEFNTAVTEALEEDSQYTRNYYDQIPKPLVTSMPGLEAIQNNLQNVYPSVGVEALFAIKLDKQLSTEELYEMISSISTMEGIEYYSASRGERRVLFNKSYVVPRRDQNSPLSDPNYAGGKLELTVYQEDSSFGGNYYSLSYIETENGVRLQMQNLNQLYYGIVPVVGEKAMIMEIYLEQRGDYLLFYGNCAVNAFTAFGIGDKAQVSFYNRIEALFNWFTAKL